MMCSSSPAEKTIFPLEWILNIYLERYQDIGERLPVGVMEVDGELLSRNNSHYSFKHCHHTPCSTDILVKYGQGYLAK